MPRSYVAQAAGCSPGGSTSKPFYLKVPRAERSLQHCGSCLFCAGVFTPVPVAASKQCSHGGSSIVDPKSTLGASLGGKGLALG